MWRGERLLSTTAHHFTYTVYIGTLHHQLNSNNTYWLHCKHRQLYTHSLFALLFCTKCLYTFLFTRWKTNIMRGLISCRSAMHIALTNCRFDYWFCTVFSCPVPAIRPDAWANMLQSLSLINCGADSDHVSNQFAVEYTFFPLIIVLKGYERMCVLFHLASIHWDRTECKQKKAEE